MAQAIESTPTSDSPAEPYLDLACADDAPRMVQIKLASRLRFLPNNELGIYRDIVYEDLYGLGNSKLAGKIDEMADAIDEPHIGEFIVMRNGVTHIVEGFVHPNVNNGVRWVSGLYVSPTARGQGFGSRLLDEGIDWHTGPLQLHVVSYNRPAVNLYQKLGFQINRYLECGFTIANIPVPQLEMVHGGH